MGFSPPGHDRVVVIGGGLAGMAAAARLAKAGHSVELFEAADRLGGRWAARDFQGVLVDEAPSIIGFPAPWRDLFRKSGRPLEAELARTGYRLSPAAPARYVFADGTELVLPTDRGDQYEVLSDSYGPKAAASWRDLVDDLDRTWQAIRPLGLESELRGRRQLSAARSALRPRRAITDLAAALGEPHLGAIITSIAYRLGSIPAKTPAWCAVELSTTRTFGRWMIDTQTMLEGTGRSSVLVEALAARLELRRVLVHLGRPITGVLMAGNRVTGVTTHDGEQIEAPAVISTADPWHTYTQLVPASVARRTRRALRRLRPALAPAVDHQTSSVRSTTVIETVALSPEGIPMITYTRPTNQGTLLTVHDYARAEPHRSAGAAWNGFSSWLDRPAITSDAAGLFVAGPFSPGGSGASQVILSGALASYACHDYLC
ncbi:MAG: FAD-dependent oxidoreductase [Propionibacteriaceae bacterium]|nr:FAD-dependent oxidoreductase [Propionibacteriaceae bacterium]